MYLQTLASIQLRTGVVKFAPLRVQILNIISLPRPQLPADDLEFSRFLCRPDF